MIFAIQRPQSEHRPPEGRLPFGDALDLWFVTPHRRFGGGDSRSLRFDGALCCLGGGRSGRDLLARWRLRFGAPLIAGGAVEAPGGFDLGQFTTTPMRTIRRKSSQFCAKIRLARSTHFRSRFQSVRSDAEAMHMNCMLWFESCLPSHAFPWFHTDCGLC